MIGRCLRAILSLGLCTVVLGAVARADTKEEIVDRMAKRLDTVKKYKAEGKIGETFDGLVAAVKEEFLDDKDLKKLVDDENADRKKFYELGAEKFKTTPEKFALSAGKRHFRDAAPEDWLKPKDAKWIQKKDLKD